VGCAESQQPSRLFSTIVTLRNQSQTSSGRAVVVSFGTFATPATPQPTGHIDGLVSAEKERRWLSFSVTPMYEYSYRLALGVHSM
jgi:hypothetical protein